MATRGRQILKGFFSNGKRPSQQEFEDLIDSSVNILDDGYSKSNQDGLKLTPKTDNNVLMSFCRQSAAEPSWIFTISDTENLLIYNKQEKHETIEKESKSSLFLACPKTVITGDVELRGIKKGRSVSDDLKKELYADGKWHDITEHKNGGVYVMEIVASIHGEPGNGEYAVLMAWATQSFDSNKKIKSVGSHYGFWGNKLKLRWHRKKGSSHYQLQIKSRLKYKNKDLPINCHITYLHKYEKSNAQKT